MLSSIPGLDWVGMTTNGITLSHKIKALKEAGLSGLNVSLDTLVSQKFEFVSRRRGWEKVMRGIDDALELGFSPLKVHGLGISLKLLVSREFLWGFPK